MTFRGDRSRNRSGQKETIRCHCSKGTPWPLSGLTIIEELVAEEGAGAPGGVLKVTPVSTPAALANSVIAILGVVTLMPTHKRKGLVEASCRYSAVIVKRSAFSRKISRRTTWP